jgi:uncharacterized membrane protein YdjX (TVP38/TMEM64 family)
LRKKIVIPFIITAVAIIIIFLLFDDTETFFANLLNNLGSHRGRFVPLSFAALASDILLPVPSSIVMFTNGYVLGTAYGSALSLLSLMTGAAVGYYLGQFTSMGLRSGSDARANSIIARYGTVSILITRGIPILAETICIICGYNKMPFKQYLLYNLAGYTPLCLLYAFCGSIGYSKDIFLLSFGCSIAIAAGFWCLGRKLFVKPSDAQ